MDASFVDVRCGLVDAARRNAADCGQHPVDVLPVLLRPGAIQGARLVRLHLRDDHVNQVAGERQPVLGIGHDVVRIIEQALGAMGTGRPADRRQCAARRACRDE